MWFSKKDKPNTGGALKAEKTAERSAAKVSTKSRGDAAERLAQGYLERAGLRLQAANYRTPGRGGGEIDLIMQTKDGTLVFVEVRQRSQDAHGGAAASVGSRKQRRVVQAARHYLLRYASPPPCRFDVLLVQGGTPTGDAEHAEVQWIQAAFAAA